MSKKQAIFSFVLALVLVLSSTGVCFADSGATVTTSLGLESFEFSNLKSSTDNNATIFFEVPAYDLPDSSVVVSDFELLGSYPLFNGLGVNVYYRNTDGNSPRILLAWTFNNTELYSLTNFTYNYIAQPSQIHFVTFRCALIGNDFQVNAGYSASYSGATANGNFRYLVNNLSPVPTVSLGNFEYNVISSTISESLPINLSKGYASLIYGPCTITARSYQIFGSWDFISNGSNRINGSMERLLQVANITDGFSPDKNRSRDQMVQWSAINTNSAGVASNYAFSDTEDIVVPSGAVFVVTYPEYYGVQGVGDQTYTFQNSVDFVGSWDIEYTGSRPVIKQVALQTVQEWVNREYLIYNVFRPAVYEETGTVSSDGSGGYVISYPSQPDGGGNNGQPALNEETNLLGIFSKFVSDVKNLFNTASQAVSDLVSTGSSFMQNIATMFTWLPAPLLSVIIGAFTVLLVVGVLKVLWR